VRLVASVIATALIAPLAAIAAPGTASAETPSIASGGWASQRISIGPNGEEGDGDSIDPSISADGMSIVFGTTATNLVPGSNAGNLVLLHDLATGLEEVVSLSTSGTSLSFPREPDVSGDASRVIMSRSSSGERAITYFDRNVAVATDVGPGIGLSSPEISAAGDRAVFVQADTNGFDDDRRQYVWFHDERTGQPARIVSQLPGLNDEASRPVISDDGNVVAYSYRIGTTRGVRVHDVTDGTVGAPEDYPAAAAALSADGRYLVTLRSGPGSPLAVHRQDRLTGEAVVVAELPGLAGNLDVSADGNVVVYSVTYRDDADENRTEIRVTDVATGATEAVAVVDSSPRVDLSADGSFVAYSTTVAVDAADTNNLADVYVARRGDTGGPTWPLGAALVADQVSSTLVGLRWAGAVDDTAVTGYRLSRDGEVVAELPAGTLAHTVTGLAPETEYRFELVALDAEGNVSAPLARDVLTNPASTDPGTAGLSASAGPGGSVHLLWEPADGADGYRVLRTDGSTDMIPVAEVDGATTEFRDAGLAADTNYWYAIEVLHGAEYALHTVEAFVTTPGVEIASVTWSARGQIGTDATIVITGAPSWIGSARVEFMSWYGTDGELLDAPRAVTTELAAAEDASSPGTYRATFPIAEGVAQITRVHGELSDGFGAGAAASVHRTLNVQGALEVEIEAPARSLEGALLVIPNVAQLPVNGGGTFSLPVVPAGAHIVRVQSAGSRTLATTTAPVVNGRRITVTLSPDLPAKVVTHVVDPDGAPVAGARVTLRQGSHLLNVAVTDSKGDAPVSVELLAEADLNVVVDPPVGDLFVGTSRAFTLVPGENVVEVTLQPIVRVPVTGTVMLSDGTPARGASVVVSQTVAGSARSASATTDDEGHYSLTAIAGAATLTVTYRSNPLRVQQVDIVAPAAVLDAVVPVPTGYQLDISLYTRELGGAWQGPLDIDWRTAVHYRMSIQGARASTPVSGAMVVDASPGDVIRVCADGRETGHTSPCTSVTLGAERNVPVEVRMESVARVVGRLITPVGAPSAHARISVSKVLPNGGLSTIFDYRPSYDGDFSLNVAEAGRYRLVVSDTVRVSSTGAASWSGTRTVDVEVVEGQMLDLGDVVLAASEWAKASSVVPNRSTVLPDGRVEIRAHLVPPGAQSGARAEFTVPAGMRLVEGSVLLGGEPVEATLAGGVLSLDLPAGSRPDGWVVRYQLQVTTAESGSKVITAATVVLPGGLREPVGAATLRVAAVTLEAPRTSSSRTVVLSGWAPAGTTVTIYDGRQAIGEAVAGQGGLWTLTTELPNLGNGRTHTLQATVEVGGTVLASEPLSVVVDARLPELERVTISRSGDYAASFDPRQGVARFPFVWAGSTMTVTARFSDRGSVADVRAEVGSYSAPAVQISDREWQATLVTGSGGLGGIDVDFVAYPEVGTLSSEPKPDVDELRAQLPPGFDQFGEPRTTVDEPTPTRTSATMTVPVPAFGNDASIRTTMTVERGVDYTITPSDLVAIRETGVEMYGFDFDHSLSPARDRMTVTTTSYVPVEQLDGESGMGINAAAGGALAKVTLSHVFTGVQLVDNANTTYGTRDKYDRLNQLLDRVQRNCDALNTDLITGRLEGIAAMALAADAMKISLMLVGTLLAPATLGVGTLVVWGATYAAGHLIDYELNKHLDDVAQEIRDHCEEDEDDEDPEDPDDRDDDRDDSDDSDDDSDGDLADPAWIYDPSGYVFEAVPSNRLSGVTATVTHSATPDGVFEPWDAEWYGQQNPLLTDHEGRYGWDVPVGFWQVVYTKAGYVPGASEVLEVLPPHFDVNVGLVSYAAPAVSTAAATPGGGVELTFTKYMDLDVLEGDRIAVSGGGGEPIFGTVEAVDAEDGPDGRFARTFRFVPELAFTDGQVIDLRVDSSASSYAGTPMGDDFEATLTVAEPRPVAPVAHDDLVATDEERAALIDVLDNDESTSDAALAVGELGQPGHGAVAFVDGVVRYIPDVDFHGIDRFTYTAVGGSVASEPATVTVHVLSRNDAPRATPVSAEVAEGESIVLDLAGAGSDVDGDVVSVHAVEQPAHGSTAVGADGGVSYTPALGYTGSDSFRFRLTDGDRISAWVTATLVVRAVNRAPVAAADSATTAGGAAVVIDVTANDRDPDGDRLTVSIVGTPEKGTLKVGADQRVTYTPAAGFSGTDSFTYRVSDPAGLTSAVTTVTITVTPPPSNDPVCTIIGTPGNDILIGTSGPDVICGLGGTDVLVGNGGNDVLLGGAGIDVLDGGAGNDVLDGGAGVDVITGGAGDDRIDGGADLDLIDGGAGRDGWRKGDTAVAVRTEYRY
jgi:chitodextrinase